MYIRTLMKLLDKEYKTIITELQVISPTFEPKGGINAPIEEGLYKTYLLQNEYMVNDDGNIVRFVSTNGAKPVINYDVDRSENLSYNDKTLADYNNNKGTAVDPLKIRAIIDSLEYTADKAIEKSGKLIQSKTILKDIMLREKLYLKTLFKDYNYVIVPINLGFRIRDLFALMFVKVYVTAEFNNKVIAYNDKETLTAYIVNA